MQLNLLFWNFAVIMNSESFFKEDDMYCPICHAEFRRGFRKCSVCGVALVKALPPEPQPEYVDWKTVLVAQDENVLMVARSRLEAEGIKCFTVNDVQDLFGPGRIVGFNPMIGPLELQVLAKDVKKAKKILDAATMPVKRKRRSG